MTLRTVMFRSTIQSKEQNVTISLLWLRDNKQGTIVIIPRVQQRKERSGLHCLTSIETGGQQSNLQFYLNYWSLTAFNLLLPSGLGSTIWLRKNLFLFLKIAKSLNY